MELSSKYNPTEVEDKWYSYWMEKGFFHSEPDSSKEPYTIVIPPPNVTGVLHMGHMLNNTIQDVLIRRARMLGKNACWVPGTDHASIATEAKVVKMLKEKGINKRDIGREDFLKHAWEWKEKYGGIILEQLKKLGASCDWDRTSFTMDPEMSESVIKIFVDLYDKGHIYRGYRMVNWDPDGRTALADDEVIYKDVQSRLFFLKYQIEGSEDTLTIATTRPETILGDTAVCINPKDERFTHLKGKRAIVPLIGRSIPIIEDSYVDMEFGTGCLKVTPAHDINDYELGKKHNLETIDIMNEDGTLSEEAQLYIGEDRFVVRKKIAKELKEKGHLEKTEEYSNSVGYSERTDAVIEPRLSLQWYVRMEELTKPALDHVMNDEVKLVPSKFKNMYRHWMENVRDWCISRQLWWGQQIPAYYLKSEDAASPDAQVFVGVTAEEALKRAQEATGNPDLKHSDLIQDEDVLDTWFSSGLWPITVFNGINEPDNEEINYYYPTNDLVTAPEILFFWVARMVMYGYEYRDQKPFENVYLTGIVRDKQGRKMSKSLGNSPDPLELIKEYGADGVRTGMLFSSPAGNDLLFDIKLCEQGRNFANKIWNAFRLVQSWEVDPDLPTETNKLAVEWFESRFNAALLELDDQFSKFRISDALMTTYKLIWDDFCSWYLEMVKPEYQKPVDTYTLEKTKELFEKVLKVLHPFMPFISEELWHHLDGRNDESCIIVAEWPKPGAVDQSLVQKAVGAFELISAIRNIRSSKNISKNQALELYLKGDEQVYETYKYYIEKLSNLSLFELSKEDVEGISMVVDRHEFIIPMEGEIDSEAELEKLEADLKYQQGFKTTCEKKLSNERFVNNAPEAVVNNEKKKLADAEAKIEALKIAIDKLKALI